MSSPRHPWADSDPVYGIVDDVSDGEELAAYLRSRGYTVTAPTAEYLWRCAQMGTAEREAAESRAEPKNDDSSFEEFLSPGAAHLRGTLRDRGLVYDGDANTPAPAPALASTAACGARRAPPDWVGSAVGPEDKYGDYDFAVAEAERGMPFTTLPISDWIREVESDTSLPRTSCDFSGDPLGDIPVGDAGIRYHAPTSTATASEQDGESGVDLFGVRRPSSDNVCLVNAGAAVTTGYWPAPWTFPSCHSSTTSGPTGPWCEKNARWGPWYRDGDPNVGGWGSANPGKGTIKAPRKGAHPPWMMQKGR
jgi:hypothetical protein